MKKIIFVTSTVILLSGCVSTRAIKDITVTKDSNGKITQTVEKESVEQIRTFSPFNFNYLEVK